MLAARASRLQDDEVGQRRTLAFLRNALRAFGRDEEDVDAARCEIRQCQPAERARAAAAITCRFVLVHEQVEPALVPRTPTSRDPTSTTTTERDPAVYTESDHMPSWAQDDPREYWDAADLYERANGRLYVSADFALPRDLSTEDQVALARSFAQELTAEERLPYTLAIHAGRDADGREHNPHAHLMISERQNDGIERSKEQWFRRANRAQSRTRRRAQESHVPRP